MVIRISQLQFPLVLLSHLLHLGEHRYTCTRHMLQYVMLILCHQIPEQISHAYVHDVETIFPFMNVTILKIKEIRYAPVVLLVYIHVHVDVAVLRRIVNLYVDRRDPSCSAFRGHLPPCTEAKICFCS